MTFKLHSHPDSQDTLAVPMSRYDCRYDSCRGDWGQQRVHKLRGQCRASVWGSSLRGKERVTVVLYGLQARPQQRRVADQGFPRSVYCYMIGPSPSSHAAARVCLTCSWIGSWLCALARAVLT